MHILEKFGKGGLIFKMNLDNTSKLVKNIPTFYQNIINSWIEIGGGQTEKPNTPTEIISQVIWETNSSNTTIKFLFLKTG